jgi:hypothetical protein
MRNQRTGIFTLLLLGGYFAYRNRMSIRRFLEARGFNLPLDTSSIGDTVRSSVAKISGKADRVSNSSDNSLRKAI